MKKSKPQITCGFDDTKNSSWSETKLEQERE
jgi:hypothetical protein